MGQRPARGRLRPHDPARGGFRHGNRAVPVRRRTEAASSHPVLLPRLGNQSGDVHADHEPRFAVPRRGRGQRGPNPRRRQALHGVASPWHPGRRVLVPDRVGQPDPVHARHTATILESRQPGLPSPGCDRRSRRVDDGALRARTPRRRTRWHLDPDDAGQGIVCACVSTARCNRSSTGPGAPGRSKKWRSEGITAVDAGHLLLFTRRRTRWCGSFATPRIGRRIVQIECPQSDSNRHLADFKSAASANWAMGAQEEGSAWCPPGPGQVRKDTTAATPPTRSTARSRRGCRAR